MAIPLGPYTPAVRHGDLLFVSGQIGIDDAGTLVEGFATQMRQALTNLTDVLQEHGSGIDKVLKATVFVTDIGTFAEMNDIYLSTFGDPLPARSTVCVAALPKGAIFEIEAIAHAG